MSKWRSNLLARTSQRNAAIEAAMLHLAQHDSSSVHHSISGVIAETANGYIVRVCYGTDIKPPRRKWYIVNSNTLTVESLSFDEVKQYGEHPWR